VSYPSLEMKHIATPFFTTLLGIGLMGAPVVQADEGKEFFENKVRPLLIEKCLDCHSAEKKIKGGLRLDTREGWQAGGDTGAALVPNDATNSLLMHAVSYTSRDLKMPPKQKLSAAEIAVFQQWIAMGAPDPRVDDGAGKVQASKGYNEKEAKAWWSFQPLGKSVTPAVQDTTWPRNEVDHYILAKLEQQEMKPAPDAAPEVLARRLYIDLTGLPPSVEELQTFVAAAKADQAKAVLALTDKLMDTPAYGERWGRHWLDMVRFAESSGGGRTLPFKDAWRYRDYVMESVNQDVPLNRFITEQLAGDLLPYDNPAERRKHLIATGFLTLGPTNYEEQDKQQLRMDIVDEQLDTLGKSFLGMTIGCARCHDHKFDPIPASDYYALAGILSSTKTLKNYTDNVAHWIDTPLPMEGDVEVALQAQEARLAVLDQELTLAKKALKKLQPKPVKLDAGKPIDPDELPGIVVDDSQAKLVGEWKKSTRYPTYIGEGYVSDANLNKGASTITFSPPIKKTGVYEVRFSYTALSDRAKKLPITILHADGEETVFVDETETPPIDGRFVSLGQFRFQMDGQGYVLLTNEGTDGYVTADAMVFIPIDELTTASALKSADKKSAQLVKAEAKVKALEEETKALKSSSLSRPEAMTVLEDSQPEDCRIHIRGSIRNLGAPVPRGFLTAASLREAPVIKPTESGRLQLAQWMTQETNPLTPRVLVNRVWMLLFGDGLVRTVDNFGLTGEKPSHPELLDALAAQFMREGWSLQKLIRHLVTSRAYQMSSAQNAAYAAKDPDNRWLWKQNRRRMDAESLRDSILVVAGTLDPKFGGPNVNAGAVDSNSAAAQDLEYSYVFSDTRRSVYAPAFRNKRLEFFEAFDFADINQPIAKRGVSTVAPQALYLMNHPFVLEQSRKAAQKILLKEQEDKLLLQEAYLKTLSRSPTERELALGMTFLQDTESGSSAREDQWAMLMQTLFASLDFRYLD
jgi:hypothetical protein